MSERLALKPTGAMTVVFEVQEFGPIEFRTVDFDIAMEVLRVLVLAGSMDVKSYTARHRKTLERLLPKAEA
jgi:hypothetical protein